MNKVRNLKRVFPSKRIFGIEESYSIGEILEKNVLSDRIKICNLEKGIKAV
jgi:hypothetical protein